MDAPKNKQFKDALNKAAQEIGKTLTRDDYGRFHDENTLDYLDSFQEILDAAREYVQ